MTTYTAIADADIDPESPGTTTLFTRLRDNPIAITEKAAGAPVLANGYVTQAMMSSSSVGQGQLKTTVGAVSTTSSTGANLTLPSGTYGFYPQIYDTSVSGTINAYIGELVHHTSYVTNIYLINSGPGPTALAQQRYIQASPPYDLGDGEVPLFVFCEVDTSGKVVSAYVAPEAPWHYNGPTNTKADYYRDGIGYQLRKDAAEIDAALIAAGYPAGLTRAAAKSLSPQAYIDYIAAFTAAPDIEVEVTQAIKQADMAAIPAPMKPSNGNTVILLDPVSQVGFNMADFMKHDEFNLNELLHAGDIVIDNTALTRATPPGVTAHAWRLR